MKNERLSVKIPRSYRGVEGEGQHQATLEQDIAHCTGLSGGLRARLGTGHTIASSCQSCSRGGV